MCDVLMVALFGIPSVFVRSWILASLHIADRPTREIDAAESMNAVLVWQWGGLAQPGGSFSSSLSLFRLLIIKRSPAGLHRHSPFGAFPHPLPSVLPPIVFWRVAQILCPGLPLNRQFALLCPTLSL